MTTVAKTITARRHLWNLAPGLPLTHKRGKLKVKPVYFVGTNGQASIGRKHSGLSCSNVPPLTNAPPPISSSTPDRRFPYSGMAESVFVVRE